MRLRSAGGSASSTGRMRKPKIGRANTRPATPSTSTAMTTRSRRDRSSPRCSARLIRDWGVSSSAMLGGLALRMRGRGLGRRCRGGLGGVLGGGLHAQGIGRRSLRGDDPLRRREDGGIGRWRQLVLAARGGGGRRLGRRGWLDALRLGLILGEDLLV